MDKEGPWGVYFRNAEPGEAIELVVWDGVGHRIKKLSRKQAMNTFMNLANTMASQQLLEEEAPGTFTDKEWSEAHEENDYFNTGTAFKKPKTHLGTCCTAMARPRIDVDGYSGPDRRDNIIDRRVNKEFSSNTPNLRKKRQHAEWGGLYGVPRYRWGRRITDPAAY